jgi:alcohol dehydrogenase class IV
MAEQRVIREDYRELDRYFLDSGANNIFLVCGKSIKRLPVGRYFAELEARMGLRLVRFSAFRPNPLYEEAAAAAAAFRSSGCDAIAAVGGGSAMDVAKCVKLWAGLNPGEDYLKQAYVPNQIPLLAAPTTAGTGSEATHFAVVYRGGEKLSVAHAACLPSAALLDPRALETLPDYHRKSSMLDALCHGLESFWSVRAGAESRSYSRKAVEGVFRHLNGYLRNDPEGNTGMLEAAHLAGKAINLAQTTAGHAMSYQLTELYGIAHGHAAALCVAELWPHMAARCGGTALEGIFAELAAAMGCGSVQEACEKLKNLLVSLGLKAPAAAKEDYVVLKRSVNQERLKNNPVFLSLFDIDDLYHRILSGKGRENP